MADYKMLDCVFVYGSDIIIVRITENNIGFAKLQGTNALMFAPLENLKITDDNIIKTFPDLKDNPNRKEIAIQRVKDYIKNLKSEKEKVNYIKKELEPFGYQLKLIQRNGWRPVSWEEYNAN